MCATTGSASTPPEPSPPAAGAAGSAASATALSSSVAPWPSRPGPVRAPRSPSPSHSGAALNPDESRLRIVLVDDHPVVRAGLRALLESQGDLVVVGEAPSAVDA